MNKPDNKLLAVEDLKKHFPVKHGFFSRTTGWVKAVDDVSFTLNKGENLGVVGESGCGKTTLGRTLLRLYEPTEGSVRFTVEDRELDVCELGRKELRKMRQHAQMIFQDPFSSLNPRMTVLDIIGEPLVVNNLVDSRGELEDRVVELMDIMDLNVRYLKRYPHAFSGGQRQRIGIARAMAPEPRLIIADEPTSALDVSVQAKILKLMLDLQNKFDVSYLFITHDLSVVHYICDRTMVMYLGRIVELGETERLFSHYIHPYTETLMKSIPRFNAGEDHEWFVPVGEPPDPASPPAGCHFHERCPYAEKRCEEEYPELREVEDGHWVSCHFATASGSPVRD